MYYIITFDKVKKSKTLTDLAISLDTQQCGLKDQFL